MQIWLIPSCTEFAVLERSSSLSHEVNIISASEVDLRGRIIYEGMILVLSTPNCHLENAARIDTYLYISSNFSDDIV